MIIAGCGTLVAALALVSKLGNDVALGISFGLAFGLILAGIIALAKGKASGT